MRTETPRPIRLEEYRPPAWLVETIEIDVKLDPTATRVRAQMRLSPNPTAAAPAPVVLDGDGLNLVSIKLDGAPLPDEDFVATPDQLTIAQPPPGPFRLEIETLVNPSANTQLMGLYRSKRAYCTQCEAEGFRRIMYFPDRPDVMSVYTTRIEADRAAAPVLLSNGNLVASGDIEGTGRHFAVWRDPFPKPCYLFALVGGALACVEDRHVTSSGREVALRIYVEPGKESLCGYAMDSLKRAMRWDEDAFGLEYDLDVFMIVAVSDFNMGAMENKGLNIFNDKYVLASPETATDADYAHIEAIIAHEYFHNWTGNRITCRDWFQLCLKEGLTVFRDQEFSSDQRSRPVRRIADVRLLRAHQFVEDAGPLAHPVRPALYHEINNFYTATVYEKGAEIVRMLKTMFGSAGFRKGMDLYFERHDGEAATVDQFVQCFADANKADLSQFMLWYAQAGTPEVMVRTHYDASARTFRLDLTQVTPPTPGQPVKDPVVIPLVTGLVGEDGGDLPLIAADGRAVPDGLVMLSKATDSIVFTGVERRPVPSLNRGFSAPIKLNADPGVRDLRFLAAHDPDPFNRWQAVQTMATALLVESARTAAAERDFGGDEGLTQALGAILADATLEPAFMAQCLGMPSETDVAREIEREVDPDAVFNARAALRGVIGRRLEGSLAQTYEKHNDRRPFSPDAASAGRRALKNAALDLLAASGAPDSIRLARTQYESADNMTDRMAALGTIALYDPEGRSAALADFYRRFETDPLVIDKWFALQATIPDPGTLDRVRNLMQHPAFSLANPNRTRALVGSFAQGNYTQFNRIDGLGYEFVADIVLALDAKNPQVAARLLASFKSWRAVEARRRLKAEAALRRIERSDALSRDVRDIVERSLASP